jgi:CRP/FNR family transcriptional regulator
MTILNRCMMLRTMTADQKAKLGQIAGVFSFDAGRRIFDQGDPCPGMYIVGRGLVRVFRLSPNGKEHVLHLVSSGGTFAEVAAIGGFDCPAYAEAVEPTVCALLTGGDLMRLLRNDHEMTMQWLLGQAAWVRHLVTLLEDITLRDAVGRLARYLLDAADERGVVVLPGLKKHLASHLNLTSETLSRTLRRLEEANLIERGDEQIRLLDRQAMSEAAVGMGPLI